MSIQESINNIKEVLKTNNEKLIMSIIIDIDPIILLYYQMTNESFKYYTDKLPTMYCVLNCDEALRVFIKINDAQFFNYAVKILKFQNASIGHKMIIHYIENNDVASLNIIKDLNPYSITNAIIDYCFQNNKHEILKQYLMNPENNDIDFAEDNEFNNTMCGPIMSKGDLIDIIKVFSECSQQFPDRVDFDFNLVFNAALVFGREKCMHFLLNKYTINYIYKKEDDAFNSYMYFHEIKTDSDFYSSFPFTDSIMYAIMGKNINCVCLVLDMFKNEIKHENWKHYINFAAVYGTLEIIKYMITIKPYMVEEIDNFYNNILKFALCKVNIDIVKFAISNEATFSESFHEFVENYNEYRSTEEDAIDNDHFDFYVKKLLYPADFDEKYAECMRIINKN